MHIIFNELKTMRMLLFWQQTDSCTLLLASYKTTGGDNEISILI
jgi:hypothetical protein